MTVDFDSTVITREGRQQGAALGYNPNRRGRNSHHPLLAFVSETKMVANAWLRPGNTAASSNCEAFMDETFEHSRSVDSKWALYVPTAVSTPRRS